MVGGLVELLEVFVDVTVVFVDVDEPSLTMLLLVVVFEEFSSFEPDEELDFVADVSDELSALPTSST